MKTEDAKRLLEQAGIEIQSESRLVSDTGVQLRCDSGAIVNVYDSGKYVLQGRKDPRVSEALKAAYFADNRGRLALPTTSNKVFVVYGHDTTARTQLEAMVRRWGLDRSS